MPKSESGSSLEDSEPAKVVPYMHSVGSVIYLKIGGPPDLAFAICKLSRYFESPLQHHWIAIIRVPRYISSIRVHRVLLQKDENQKVYGYFDSLW